MMTKFHKIVILLVTGFVVIVIFIFSLYFVLIPSKDYNKESGKYVKLLKILSNRKISAEKKERAFQSLVYVSPIIREIYSLDRPLLVEERQVVYLPIEHELIIRRKMFIDNHLISLAKFEDVLIPLGDKVFLKGYNIVPHKKVDLIFNGFLELEEGRHRFKYVLDMKIVKKEKGGLRESIYNTTLESYKEFTVINKLPGNYISLVSYRGLDKHIEMDIKVISFKEDSVFNPAKGMEYQKLSITTGKPSPEHIASKVLVLSKNGNLLGKIGNLMVFKGETLKNFSVPLNLTKLGAGKHKVIIKLVPNKNLALENARMRKVWSGTVKKEITFEIRKRKVEKIIEEPEKKEIKEVKEKKVVKPKKKKQKEKIKKEEEVKKKLEEKKIDEKEIKEEKKEPEKKEEEKVDEKKKPTEKIDEKKETKEEVKPKEETKKEVKPEAKPEPQPEPEPTPEPTPAP